jgi:dihydroorotate dehydrogenase
MQNFVFQQIVQPALFAMPPEMAHNATIVALRMGLAGGPGVLSDPRLRQELWGLNFHNPIGLAAGFDKHAECILPLFRLGFGAVELGSVTPQPQPGNVRPRVFRDIAAGAVINRYGFPSVGLEKFVRRAQHDRSFTRLPGVLGINLGKNKNQADPIADYLTGMRATHNIADYWVINVSSPNTPGLRDLQQKSTLTELLAAAQTLRAEIAPHVPLLLKIAPDLTDEALTDIVSVIITQNLSGLIVSNTTITRGGGIDAAFAAQAGGLSGRPLLNLSTRMLREIRIATQGKIPLIGVGGIDSAEAAYAKIRAGASLLQLYTGLVYAGPDLIPQLFQGLLNLMTRDGFHHISEAIGQA